MRNATNNMMTIRAAMVLLLAANVATPRGFQTGGHAGAPAAAHNAPLVNRGQQLVNRGQPLVNRGQPLVNHGQPLVNHGQPLINHHGPQGMPHGAPHVAPYGPIGHSMRGGYHPQPFHNGGGRYVNVYRPYHYRGFEFHAYRPMRFFTPRFYGWVDAPWAYRVHYRWGWFGSPWFVGYRGYFTPYAFYNSAPFWLTDYLIASSLQAAWAEGVAPCACYGMTPLVKESIAAEVRRQIAMERAESTGYQTSSPAFLDGNRHIFVVNQATTAYAGNQACPLTGGDVVQLDGAAAVNGTNATVQVVASKAQDCTTGSYVGITLAQLQDMENSMRQSIDQGMNTLQTEQGQNGLPTLAAGM